MPLDGTYEFTVNTPLGRQTGTLELTVAEGGARGGYVHATAKAPLVGTIHETGVARDDIFVLSGSVRVMFKKIDYELEGYVRGDQLHITATSGGSSMDVVGTRVG